MKRIYYLTWVFTLLGLLSCSKTGLTPEDNDDEGEGIDVVVDENFTTNSQTVSYSNSVIINYSSDKVNITNPYSNQGVSITVDGYCVTVSSTIKNTEINYILSGNCTNGMFKLYSDYNFGIVLNGVSIINTNGPAINIQSEKNGILYLVPLTNNRAVDSKVYPSSTEDQKGAIYSEGSIEFKGEGNLVITGRNKHGVCSDDCIIINSGNIKVDICAKDGFHVNDYFKMDGGTISVKALGEGIESEEGYVEINGGNISITTTEEKGMGIKSKGDIKINQCESLTIAASGNGAKGFKSSGNILIEDGNIDITTSGNAFYDTDESDIASPAGMKSDGNITIRKGTISIQSSGTAGKGISADGAIIIDGGNINIITSGGQFKYGMDDSSAKGIKSEGNLTVNGGIITVKTSGAGAEGIESKSILTLSGGEIEVTAYDDCVNSTGQILINNVELYCYSTTNDGVDSNGPLTINGGKIFSCGTSTPEEGFDCDNNTFKINGGTIVGIGGATSNPTSSLSAQRSLVYGAGNISTGQIINVQTSDGKEIIAIKVPRSYNSATLLVSSPDFSANTSYIIYKGGTVSGGIEFHGIYSGSVYTAGTIATTFTISSMVTTIGTQGGNPGKP
jgi:hypothetical protein